MRAADCTPALAAILCIAAGLASCRSSPPEPPPGDSWRDQKATLPGSFSAKNYNLGVVVFWEVTGSWADIKTPWGKARKAIGEGPHEVLVQVSFEADPRAHEVGTGAVVGVSGDILMIEDPTEGE
jgi:hypothetical protein